MTRANNKDYFKVVVCECGKEFIPSYCWLYKLKPRKNTKTRYFCSYSCWRKAGGDGGRTHRK